VLTQFLIQDLFFSTVLAAFMGRTQPRSYLAREKPLDRVVCVPLMTSTFLQLIVVVLFQCMGLVLLQAQPGYTRTVRASMT
jgi:cation-transporting ATPase 13A3/4/5